LLRNFRAEAAAAERDGNCPIAGSPFNGAADKERGLVVGKSCRESYYLASAGASARRKSSLNRRQEGERRHDVFVGAAPGRSSKR
jgi:hypothetical protein